MTDVGICARALMCHLVTPRLQKDIQTTPTPKSILERNREDYLSRKELETVFSNLLIYQNCKSRSNIFSWSCTAAIWVVWSWRWRRCREGQISRRVNGLGALESGQRPSCCAVSSFPDHVSYPYQCFFAKKKAFERALDHRWIPRAAHQHHPPGKSIRRGRSE
jgi:hypothetical protein